MKHDLNYHRWANEQVLRYLSTLPTEIYERVVASSFPTVRQTVEHMVMTDYIWFNRITGNDMTRSMEFTTPAHALDSMRVLYDEMVAYFSPETSEDQVVHYTNSQGTEFRNSIGEILRHVVNHGTYHRGNLGTMLRQLGHSTVQTDYIVYLRS